MQSVEDRLVEALAAEARGPKRNGVYAIWLFARVAEGLLPPEPLTAPTNRRRLEALQGRLSSLSLPAPLRRAVTGAIRQAADGSPHDVVMALQQLVAPARETVGPGVARALEAAVAQARNLVNNHEEA
jgi:hypothetical protein